MDDGSLPTDAEGLMPFFFMDAHEEANTPGTLHLFGKASLWSCCRVTVLKTFCGIIHGCRFVPYAALCKHLARGSHPIKQLKVM